MGIDRVGIVSIRKTSKNKQIFIDRVRNDRVRNDRARNDRVRYDQVTNDIKLYLRYFISHVATDTP